MTELIRGLQSLKRYRFSIREYKLNHSELVLSAINPEDTSLRFTVRFADVYYIQLPTSWIGSFEIGSDSEREEIMSKIGSPKRGIASAVKLFKSLQSEILILGALMLMEPTDT